MIANRAEWTIDYNGIAVNTFYIFGWKCHQHIMPPASKYVMLAEKDYEVDQLPNRSIFVRGEATAEHESGLVYPNRVAGHYSQDRDKQLAGKTITTALVETEMWCINYNANGRQLPHLTPVCMKAGESYEFKRGQYVFLMHGESDDLVGPRAFIPTENMMIEADTDLYAYIFSAVRGVQ